MEYRRIDGKLVKKTKAEWEVIDEANKPAPTVEEQIQALKQKLTNTDYKAIKAFEGFPSDDWEELKVQRESWRQEINKLKGE